MNPRPGGDARNVAVIARHRAAQASTRAARAEAAAERHELLAAQPGNELHAHIAATHRRSAACHASSARLQDSYARRLEQWARGPGTPPRFMSGVAEACGADSASLTLVDADRNQLAVSASGEQARTAQDLEYVLDQGPNRDAMSERRLIVASGSEIAARWPIYGPPLVDLGVTEVAAIPLPGSGPCPGSVALYDPAPGLARSAAFSEIATTLARIVLLGPEADPELYGDTDHRPEVHQAAGILSVQAGCSIDDALALIKARAFAESIPAEAVARQILRRHLELD